MPGQIDRYVICQGNSPEHLTVIVQAKLNEGFTLQGGVAVVTLMDGFVYLQTMIRHPPIGK